MERTEVPGMNREERLSRWIESYSDAILRTCFLYLSDQAQAEDALQDTLIKAWRHMGEYERKGVVNDKAWLMRIAINTCKDYKRTAWFRHIDSRQALDELPPGMMQTEMEDRNLTLVVMDLPDRYKQVVLLYYFQGLTQRETAHALGLSPAAVVRRLRAAEALLKQSLTGVKMMKRKQMRDQIQKSLNAELSGLRTSSRRRNMLYQNAVGGYRAKRKLTVGWVVAVTLMLLTVTAVAAILLSGKDFVNQYLVPMSQQTEDVKWTDEEMKQILMLAEENGVEITEDIREALESSDPVYKEELLRMFMKIDLGFYPATWPLEEQVWYDELLFKYGMKEEITRFMPTEGEISEQEALDIAEKYVLENWSVDISKGQYTRYVQYMLSQDDESGAVNKRWDIEYEAEDGTMYVLCLTPEGRVIEDGFSTYVHKPRNVAPEKEDIDDEVWKLARRMMDDQFYTVETLARFQMDYAELIEAAASSNDQQVILMRLLLEIPYAEPRETDISPEEAFAAAREAARIAGWNDDWLERCKYSVSYRDYDDAEPTYRICFKLKADQRDLFYGREMPFGIVVYINPVSGEVISINELNELDEYDRYCEFPDPHDSYDSLGNG